MSLQYHVLNPAAMELSLTVFTPYKSGGEGVQFNLPVWRQEIHGSVQTVDYVTMVW